MCEYQYSTCIQGVLSINWKSNDSWFHCKFFIGSLSFICWKPNVPFQNPPKELESILNFYQTDAVKWFHMYVYIIKKLNFLYYILFPVRIQKYENKILISFICTNFLLIFIKFLLINVFYFVEIYNVTSTFFPSLSHFSFKPAVHV